MVMGFCVLDFFIGFLMFSVAGRLRKKWQRVLEQRGKFLPWDFIRNSGYLIGESVVAFVGLGVVAYLVVVGGLPVYLRILGGLLGGWKFARFTTKVIVKNGWTKIKKNKKDPEEQKNQGKE
ncbi:MAG: hypothetical protein GY858_09930 [Candidatus Omnitrophica bacterium]|nr:hypothetical protein [Candidatus Omnitrophota bacterium]